MFKETLKEIAIDSPLFAIVVIAIHNSKDAVSVITIVILWTIYIIAGKYIPELKKQGMIK